MQQGMATGIRGPTAHEKATDRAGNAAGGGKHRDGSGINHPSRATRLLGPAFSVGRGGMPVKITRCVGARDRGGAGAVGAAGNRTGIHARAADGGLPARHAARESGMNNDAR